MISRWLLFSLVMAWPVAGDAADALPPSIRVGAVEKAPVPFDLERLKVKWRERIRTIKTKGKLPVIDIESSFDPGKLDARDLAKDMDEEGIALIAFSPEVGRGEFDRTGSVWSDGARRAISVDPDRYIPTSTAGVAPAWTEKPDQFLETTVLKAVDDNYPLLGEFEFRHYPSSRQLKRGHDFRDVSIPIDSPLGKRLFAFSEKTGIPFQIHYEVEDTLLPPLEQMLKAYPKAKVIWCHLGQVRYASRARTYGPAYIRKLLEKYPNLYFDLAFGGPASRYFGSNEYHARVWSEQTRREWVQVIADYPWRFLAALDIGADRMDQLPKKAETLRKFLELLPEGPREVVADRAAWKLLFGEDLKEEGKSRETILK